MADALIAEQPTEMEKTASPFPPQSQAPTLRGSPSNTAFAEPVSGPDADVEKAAVLNWRYLTFNTDLPAPNPVSTRGAQEAFPDAPDLNRFENPQAWHWLRKAVTVGISCSGGIMVAYASSSYAFAVQGLVDEFHLSTDVANMGITFYNLGFGFTPMLCAPLSESIGRYPVFVASGFLFLVTQLCCGVTTTYPGLMIARFLAGAGGSTFSTIIGGIVSDMYAFEDRNTPMGIFSSMSLVGVGSGLAVSGAIAQHNSWRWIFYAQTIMTALPVLLVTIFLKETRGSVILRKRARALNKWYEKLEEKGFLGVQALPLTDSTDEKTSMEEKKDSRQPRYEIIRWRVEADDVRPGVFALIGLSLYRPFHMLFTEPVVFFFSLWAMFAWSILYVTFESIPLTFTVTHGFGDYQNGLVFVSMVIGTYLALAICIVADGYLKKYTQLRKTPEGRLIVVAVLSALMPIGLFWFGWTQRPSIPWIVPVLGVGCLSMGIFTIYLAVFNYLADVYGIFASSAMAAQSFCRNVTSSTFPYFSNIMFIRLGFGPASSLLGGIATLLMLAPILLLLNGAKIRARSHYMGS